MPTPSIQTLRADAQQVLNLDSISAVRSVVAATLANANGGTPLNPNLTTQQLWNEFYQIVTQPKSDIESIIANQLMKFLYAPPAPGGAGADKQVIFNDGGVLAGDPQFLWNKTTNLLTVTGSATITGDLTVRTNKLAVTSTGVGCGTASPTEALHVNKSSGTGVFVRLQDSANSNYIGTDNGNFRILNGTSPVYDLLNIQQLGVFTFGDGAGGTRMTLNATGLGVGLSPSYKLDASATNNLLRLTSANGNDCNIVLTQSGVGNWMLYNAATNGQLRFQFGGNDRMIVDTSGNVGIGVTPSAWGGSYKALQLQSVARNIAATGAGSGDLTVAFNAIYDSTDSRWEYAGTGDKAGRYSQTGSGNHRWFVSNTAGTAGNEITDFASPAMTLDASGNLLVGLTADSFQPTKGIAANASNSSRISVGHANGTASGDYYHSFAYNGAVIGSITQNGTTGVLYNITSDYRLKESVQPLVGGLARVSALKPSIYKWKSDGSNGEGFLAHELAEVVPFAVSGEKDAVNEDGSIKSQGIDMSRVVPILVAAIQELTARVQTLEAK